MIDTMIAVRETAAGTSGVSRGALARRRFAFAGGVCPLGSPNLHGYDAAVIAFPGTGVDRGVSPATPAPGFPALSSQGQLTA